MNDSATTVSPLHSRREFVRAVTLAGGGLALAWRLPALAAEPSVPAFAGTKRPAAFVHIGTDDRITFISPAVEMGQGAHTAMPMILMEELGGDWKQLTVRDAPPSVEYNNPMLRQQMTVGSFSVRGWYTELRKVGAAAREMLVQAAALRWQVPAAECWAANSLITHGPSGRRVRYAEVAEAAALLPVPKDPALKSERQFSIIGVDRPRLDVPAKVNGSAVFGSDVVLPDMLHAAVKVSPTFGGVLKSFDDSAAKSVKGYRGTVALADGVIAVADSYWQAKKALDQVKVEYDPGALASLSSASISATLRAALASDGTVARNDGDANAALINAKPLIEATYEAPYLAHACMEPMNCVASVSADGCELWCGTQAPQSAQRAAAAVLGIPAEQIKVNVTYLGGGFGRRGEADYVAHAAAASKAMGRPVKVLWSREEDIQHDWYRPAAVVGFRAALDAERRLSALECRVVTASSPSTGGAGAPFFTGGFTDAGYAIPNFRVTGVNANIGIRFGYWRSVNYSHNPFMLEGFLDEIARRAKQDPYQFRRQLLQHEKAQRQLQVLDAVAEKAGWGRQAKGRFQGIAAFQAYGGFIGTVAEISVRGKGITLHRLVTAIDCGTAIYPDNIHAQLESGIAYGLAAVLRGEITFAGGAVQQSNFHDYPMLTMKEMPRMETHIVPSTAPPGGVGEPGTATIAPALANALYAATGTRVRSLPLSKHGYSFAVSRS